MRALVPCALLLMAGLALAAAAPTVVATASKSEVSVGEVFAVEVRAEGPPGCTFMFPGDLAEESFELATATAPPGSAAPAPGVHRYRAAVFALGDVAVPAIPVRYRLADGTGGEIATAPIQLQVRTLLPKDKGEQKLADVRAPVRLSIGRLVWIFVAILVALLLAISLWLWLLWRRPAPAVVQASPALAPDAEARAALAALAGSGRLSRAEYRPFYIELTAIAKRYLERRLEAPILEMTTAEMLAHLRQRPVTAEMGPLLRDLSGAADQIKFARGSGVVDEAERHLAAVGSLIDGLEARLAPATPQDGRAA